MNTKEAIERLKKSLEDKKRGEHIVIIKNTPISSALQTAIEALFLAERVEKVNCPHCKKELYA